MPLPLAPSPELLKPAGKPGFNGSLLATSVKPFFSGACVAVTCPANTTGPEIDDSHMRLQVWMCRRAAAASLASSDLCQDVLFILKYLKSHAEVLATSQEPFYQSSCTALECPKDSLGDGVPSGCKCKKGQLDSRAF